MGNDPIALDPVVRAISNDLTVIDGIIALAPGRLEHWLRELAGTPQTARAALVTDLIALSLKIRDKAGETGLSAIVQLAELAVELALSPRDVADAFSNSGIDLRAALRTLGTETRPSAAERSERKMSLLDLLTERSRR